jgi:organic radical activating enzyme
VSEPSSPRIATSPRRKVAELYLFDTCTLKCGYCWLAESGNVLDQSQLDQFRDLSQIGKISSFFLSRTTPDAKWLLLLTGGEPLIAPNLDRLLAPLHEAGNSTGYYTALMVGSNHPGFRFLLEHPYPQTDYVMASLHPESEADENRYFEKIRRLKDAGHRVFLRYVAHPRRLHRLDELSERCREMDVAFYPTTLLSNRYPGEYTLEERARLSGHFSSLSQHVQLAGGLDTTNLLCHAGSRIIAIHLQTGNITPCITVHRPSLGNIYEDRLELAGAPASCPEPGIDCVCDVHFQQDIVVGAEDGQPFEQLCRGYEPPRRHAGELEGMQRKGLAFYPRSKIGVGGVANDQRLFYSIEEVRENYRATRKLPRTSLHRSGIREVAGSIGVIEICDARARIESAAPPTRIVTPSQQWSWGASAPLSIPEDIDGEIWLRIRAATLTGEGAFGILNRSEPSFQDRCFIKAGAPHSTFFLRVSNAREASRLVIENSGQDGRPAEILLEAVTIIVAAA